MTTHDIVAALRENARGLYYHAMAETRGARRYGFRVPLRLHQDADAMRRAAKRLSRLVDEALMDKVANHKSAEWWRIEAFRAAVTGGQG